LSSEVHKKGQFRPVFDHPQHISVY